MSRSSSEKLGECLNTEGPVQPPSNRQSSVLESFCGDSVMNGSSPTNMVQSSPAESDVQMLARDFPVEYNYHRGLHRSPVPYQLVQVGSAHQLYQPPTYIQGQYHPVSYTQPPYGMVATTSTSGYGPNSVAAATDYPSPHEIGCYGKNLVNNMMVTSVQSTPLPYTTSPHCSPSQGKTIIPIFSPTQRSNGLATMMASGAPRFCLNQNAAGCVMPQVISRNIRPASTQVEMQSTYTSTCPYGNQL